MRGNTSLMRLGRSLFFTVMLVLAWPASLLVSAQMSGQTTPESSQRSPESSYSAIAAPGAVVVSSHARFTVLTPQLIRMEWAADGNFEDRPSTVFLNRRLAVPAFKVTHKGKTLILETSALVLRYIPQDN